MHWHLPLMTVCDSCKRHSNCVGTFQGAGLVSDDRPPTSSAIQFGVEDVSIVPPDFPKMPSNSFLQQKEK